MNIRKTVLTVIPLLVALVNLGGNFAFLGVFMACADSLTPCTPTSDQLVLSGIFGFPIVLLPTSYGYLGFLMNAALWGAAAYVLLRLALGK